MRVIDSQGIAPRAACVALHALSDLVILRVLVGVTPAVLAASVVRCELFALAARGGCWCWRGSRGIEDAIHTVETVADVAAHTFGSTMHDTVSASSNFTVNAVANVGVALAVAICEVEGAGTRRTLWVTVLGACNSRGMHTVGTRADFLFALTILVWSWRL